MTANTQESPGLAIRERALECIDEERDFERGIMTPNAEKAFRMFFGQEMSGTYEPRDERYPSRVSFDLEDGLCVWYVRNPRKGSRGNVGRYQTTWYLVAPCETKNCDNPVVVRKIVRLRDLGDALDRGIDAVCSSCRES